MGIRQAEEVLDRKKNMSEGFVEPRVRERCKSECLAHGKGEGIVLDPIFHGIKRQI